MAIGYWVRNTLVMVNQVKTRTTRTSAFWEYPPCRPHDYPYYWFISDPMLWQDKVKVTNFKILPKIQILEFCNNHYMQHTFWSCLIRCANIKWIRQVLWKIQSRHDFVHRRMDRRTDRQTDGRCETSIPPFQLCWSKGYNNVVWL